MNDDPEPAYTERPDEVLRREDVLNLLKPRINELLWSCLPSSTPLGLADRIATEFFERIMRVWDAAETTAAPARPPCRTTTSTIATSAGSRCPNATVRFDRG